jgi:hypothetical protein
MVVGFITTCANSAYHHLRCELDSCPDEVCSTQHYVIKFGSDFRQVCGFLLVLWFPSPIKFVCHDIAEILLKVALNTIPYAAISGLIMVCCLHSSLSICTHNFFHNNF